MKLRGNNGTLVLDRSELGAADTQADEDVLLNVTVDVSGFGAMDQSWVTAKAWAGFLGELRALEQRRQGRATLVAASPEDLQLEFFSTDRALRQPHRTQQLWRGRTLSAEPPRTSPVWAVEWGTS